MDEYVAISEVLGRAKEGVGTLQDFIVALAARHAVALRLRNDTTESDFESATQVPWFNRGRFVPFESRPSRSLSFVIGNYYLQDAGSMLALAACQIRPQMRVCDLCAAPGGKATGLAEMLGDQGWLLANEAIAGRVAPIEFNLARTGSCHWGVSQSDPERLADRLPSEFDLVLVDAPCSGQTMVARNKQSQAAWSMRQVQHSAARQRRILEAAVRLLRPGGQLVYSTCTFAELENEAHLDWLVADHGAIPQVHRELQAYASYRDGCYRLWPHRHACAGAFVASLTLGEPRRTLALTATKPSSGRKKNLDSKSPDLSDWGTMGPAIYLARGAQYFAWPEDFPRHWTEVLTSGPEVSYMTGKTWLPAYALALRRDANWQPQQTIELDPAEVRAFLTGQAIPSESVGWSVVQSGDRPIGWGKADGRRIKPALPPALRALAANLTY